MNDRCLDSITNSSDIVASAMDQICSHYIGGPFGGSHNGRELAVDGAKRARSRDNSSVRPYLAHRLLQVSELQLPESNDARKLTQ